MPWTLDLTGKGIVMLQARTLAEAVAFCRAYPLLLVIADLTAWDGSAREGVRQLTDALASLESPVPMAALYRSPLNRAQKDELAQSGLDLLISHEDPERSLLWNVELLAELRNLNRFQTARMDVGKLASQTRARLHDLSQPLAVIQGRLQLLAAKSEEGDPNSQCLHDLASLALEMSNQVIEMQNIHRDYT